MWSSLPLFPEAASTIAGRVDALYIFLIIVSTFFVLLIFGLIFYFAIKYRRRSEDEQPPQVTSNVALEVVWIAIPFVLVMIIFVWGASLFFTMSHPPEAALEVFVVGKQWMWKVQHPEGRREINELHVPAGYPVKLTLTSEDVIHSFYVPAFRIKMDAVPGRYEVTWFQATQPGSYHLFCAEYCGTSHAGMGGRIVVLKPADYQQWLRAGSVEEPLAAAGERLFRELGCSGCHGANSNVRAPALEGLYGKPVPLQSGQVVTADEAYIRDSILLPHKDVAAGYAPIMPPFQGRVSEEDLMQIIAYIRSLATRTSESTTESRKPVP